MYQREDRKLELISVNFSKAVKQMTMSTLKWYENTWSRFDKFLIIFEKYVYHYRCQHRKDANIYQFITKSWAFVRFVKYRHWLLSDFTKIILGFCPSRQKSSCAFVRKYNISILDFYSLGFCPSPLL